jgi:hypothetical protein
MDPTLTDTDRGNAAYLAHLRDSGEKLTDAEALLVARWAGEGLRQRPKMAVPWFSALAGACLWTVTILAILLGFWVMGL